MGLLSLLLLIELDSEKPILIVTCMAVLLGTSRMCSHWMVKGKKWDTKLESATAAGFGILLDCYPGDAGVAMI